MGKLYLELSRKVLPGIARQEGFPLWHAHTTHAFWLLLMPGHPLWARPSQCCPVLSGLQLIYWRRLRCEPDLLFPGAIGLTLWITPHAMIKIGPFS